MTSNQPHILTANGKRRFACSPVAILVFILNEREEVLLLAHPEREGGWQVINIVPPGQKWLVGRAVELYRLWKEREVELQPELFHPQEVKPK